MSIDDDSLSFVTNLVAKPQIYALAIIASPAIVLTFCPCLRDKDDFCSVAAGVFYGITIIDIITFVVQPWRFPR